MSEGEEGLCGAIYIREGFHCCDAMVKGEGSFIVHGSLCTQEEERLGANTPVPSMETARSSRQYRTPTLHTRNMGLTRARPLIQSCVFAGNQTKPGVSAWNRRNRVSKVGTGSVSQ